MAGRETVSQQALRTIDNYLASHLEHNNRSGAHVLGQSRLSPPVMWKKAHQNLLIRGNFRRGNQQSRRRSGSVEADLDAALVWPGVLSLERVCEGHSPRDRPPVAPAG